jgi:hypothetical protein
MLSVAKIGATNRTMPHVDQAGPAIFRMTISCDFAQNVQNEKSISADFSLMVTEPYGKAEVIYCVAFAQRLCP